MVTWLTEKQIRYAINQCRKGTKTSTIATQLNVTQRRIQQLYAEFRRTGIVHVPLEPGRPPVQPTSEEIQTVLDMHSNEPVGVLRIAEMLRPNHNISNGSIYRIMKDNGLVVSSAAKSKKRKWIRFERRY